MGTPARYYSSTAVRTTLASSIGASDTSLQVASDSGFPTSYPFSLVLEKDSANEEIVTVTALVGAAFTVTRGVDGTSGRTHSAGTSVEHALIALDLTDFRSHQAAGSNVHDVGAGSSVVGTDTAQTLTNKTLTSPTVNGATVTGTVSGGTLSGQTVTSATLGSDLAAGGYRVTGLADPSSAQDAATKNWAETAGTSFVTQASTQASNAATSATAAAGSATAAASSATAAAGSATSAGTAQTAAEAAQAAAETAETNAGTSATAAAGSASTAASEATDAASSATAAAASATAAASSATAAAGSATSASGSATSASTSAAAAAASAASAAATYDQFDDRYLGAKSSAPTLDNDGDALVAGALYFDTTIGAMYSWDGSSWVAAGTGGAGATGGGTDETFYENDTNVTTSYTITSGKNAGSFGPVTIGSGVTVTVPSGSVWTVV